MPSIHRYLGGLLKSRPGRILVAGATVPALLLAVAACGAAASASPSAAGSPSPGSVSRGSASPGSASAYFNCLREHGVTGGYGASTSSGSNPSSSTINSARKACASLRPSGGFGGSGRSGGFSAAFAKFEGCLSAHGVTLPSPSASGGGFRDLFSELQSNPADKAAFSACKSDLPFTPGSSGGGSGNGGTSSGTGTT